MGKHHFPWREALLEALRQYPVLSHGARAVGVDRVTVWRAIKADEDLAAAVDDALEEGIDRAEQEAFRRGVVGYEEPLTYQGRLTYAPVRDEAGAIVYDAAGEPLMQPVTIRKHSDAMLALVLKGRRKKYYSERTELTAADGAPLYPEVPMDETARAARMTQLLELARQRKEQHSADEERFGDLA